MRQRDHLKIVKEMQLEHSRRAAGDQQHIKYLEKRLQDTFARYAALANEHEDIKTAYMREQQVAADLRHIQDSLVVALEALLKGEAGAAKRAQEILDEVNGVTRCCICGQAVPPGETVHEAAAYPGPVCDGCVMVNRLVCECCEAGTTLAERAEVEY